MGMRGAGVVVGDLVFHVLFYLHCAFKSPALELESPQYQSSWVSLRPCETQNVPNRSALVMGSSLEKSMEH